MNVKKFSIVSPVFIVILFMAVTINAQTKGENKMSVKLPVITQVKHPEWSYRANIYEVNIRQYTAAGTFKAFQKHLPRLEKMGVKILWLMPIYPIGKKNRKGKLGSYYSVQNYEAVNPNFGNMDDLISLVKDAHERGMKVILDWVANHTSWDNVWVNEHPDWYVHNKKGDFVSPFDWTDVIQLNYKNKNMRKAMTNAMEFWIKKADIDGYRCDVAGMVPVDFWNHTRKELEKLKPVFMLAEDEDNFALMQKAFDMNYTWKMLHLMNDIAQGKKPATDIWNYFKWEDATFGPNVFRMYFTSNHDENSWNGTAFQRLGKAFKAFTVYDYTVPGMPLIYGGEEAGNNKRLRFFDKDTIIWTKLPYESFYTKLNDLKYQNHALWNGLEGGKLMPLSKNQDTPVIAFYRKKGHDKIVVIINFSNKSQSFKLEDVEIQGTFKNYFSGDKINIDPSVNFNLKPWDYIILEKH